jgi:uncharacterized protein (DUF2336 family)
VLPAEAVPKKPAPGEAAEEVRQQLRAMMRSAPMGPAAATPAARSHYSRLRDAALSGHAPFLHTALADALGMEYDAIREMADEQTPEWLIYALRLLDVSDEQAFLVTAAIYPWLFGDLAAIRRFVSRYAAVGQTEAAERIARCRTTVAQPADSTETAADSHQDQDGLRFRQAIATSPRLSSPRPR